MTSSFCFNPRPLERGDPPILSSVFRSRSRAGAPCEALGQSMGNGVVFIRAVVRHLASDVLSALPTLGKTCRKIILALVPARCVGTLPAAQCFLVQIIAF